MLHCLIKQPNSGERKIPDKEGNMREYATIEQLLVLANIEAMNAVYSHEFITA